jgi:hypothetical protein
MQHLEKLNQTSFSTLFAIGSFLIGTILFMLYMAFPNDDLLITGMLYVAVAVLLNLLILINLTYLFITIPFERTEVAIRILILLSNIPVSILYFYAVCSVYEN